MTTHKEAYGYSDRISAGKVTEMDKKQFRDKVIEQQRERNQLGDCDILQSEILHSDVYYSLTIALKYDLRMLAERERGERRDGWTCPRG